jgi:hypothetical protein
LLAQIFLFDFEQRFRIALFSSGNEQTQKAFEKIADAMEHGPYSQARRMMDLVPGARTALRLQRS